MQGDRCTTLFNVVWSNVLLKNLNIGIQSFLNLLTSCYYITSQLTIISLNHTFFRWHCSQYFFNYYIGILNYLILLIMSIRGVQEHFCRWGKFCLGGPQNQAITLNTVSFKGWKTYMSTFLKNYLYFHRIDTDCIINYDIIIYIYTEGSID